MISSIKQGILMLIAGFLIIILVPNISAWFVSYYDSGTTPVSSHNNRYRCSQFTANATGEAYMIGVNITQVDGASCDLNYSIWADNGNEPGSIIAEMNYTTPSATGWLDLDNKSANISLTNQTEYWICFKATGCDASNRFYVKANEAGGGISAYSTDGASWTQQANYMYNHRVNMNIPVGGNTINLNTPSPADLSVQWTPLTNIFFNVTGNFTYTDTNCTFVFNNSIEHIEVNVGNGTNIFVEFNISVPVENGEWEWFISCNDNTTTQNTSLFNWSYFVPPYINETFEDGDVSEWKSGGGHFIVINTSNPIIGTKSGWMEPNGSSSWYSWYRLPAPITEKNITISFLTQEYSGDQWMVVGDERAPNQGTNVFRPQCIWSSGEDSWAAWNGSSENMTDPGTPCHQGVNASWNISIVLVWNGTAYRATYIINGTVGPSGRHPYGTGGNIGVLTNISFVGIGNNNAGNHDMFDSVCMCPGFSNSSCCDSLVNDTGDPVVGLVSPPDNNVTANNTVVFVFNFTDSLSSTSNCTLNINYPDMCYQETANVSTGCGGLSTGNYVENNDGNVQGWVYMNYTKPIRALNTSLWLVKHGLNHTNLSLIDCWGADANKLILRMYTSTPFFSIARSYSECYNGSSWIVLSNTSAATTSTSYSTVLGYQIVFDGDWNTYVVYGNAWRLGGFGELGKLFEEAMWWNFSDVQNSSVSNNTETSLIMSLPDGVYNWNITCIDLAGNSNVSVSRNLTVDSSGPVVTALNPADNNETGNRTPLFNFSSSDSFSSTTNCSLVINGSLFGSNNSVLNNTPTYIISNSTLSPGGYVWTINCTDSLNNLGSSVPRTIVIKGMELGNPIPANGVNLSFIPVEINVTGNFTFDSNCSLIVNNVTNQTINGLGPGIDVMVNYSLSAAEGNISWFISCEDDFMVVNTSLRWFLLNYSDTISLGDSFPVTGSLFNDLPIFFNVTGNFTFDSNCSFLFDGVLNETVAVGNGTNVFVNFTLNNVSEGNISWFISCMDIMNIDNTSIKWFTFDFQPPVITDDFVNNTMVYETANLSAQFNFTDNLLLHTLNVTIDGTSIFNVTHIHADNYSYNLSYNVTGLSVGNHELVVRIADGHTSDFLKKGKDYNPSNGLLNDYIKYDFKGSYKKMFIKTELEKKSFGDSWSTERKVDRYTETLIPGKRNGTQTFVVTSDQPIYIASVPGFYGGEWLIIGDHWKDFVLLDEPESRVKIKRINDYKVKVSIEGIKNNPGKLVFDSVGDLNIVNVTYNFVRVNMTETYTSVIISGFETSYALDVDLGGLLFNLTGLTPVGILDFNGTNMTSTLLGFDNTSANFTINVTVPEVNYSANITHRWYFNLTNFTDPILFTLDQEQQIYNVTVGLCVYPVNHTIINFSYFDEITLNRTNLTNTYDLAIYDGTFYYNQTNSTFPRDISNRLCTNIDPAITTYNWDLWGSFILSEPGYITRVIDISEAVPIPISNNPYTNYSFFLIKVANSSTVKFNWLTENFQLVDGIMRVFRCGANGTRNLVASTSVISGATNVNLELLTAAYSYDIIIDGLIFSDPSGYSKCHVESQTEITYFVDTGLTDITPIIGLHGIQCLLNRSAVDVVTMTWNSNLQDASFVQGCLGAYVSNIYGSSLVQENCSNESDGFSFQVNFSSLGLTDYTVVGELRQKGLISVCDNIVPFKSSTPAQDTAGVTFLIAAFFIVASMILIFAGDGEVQLVGGIVGLIGVAVLGLLKFPISVIISLIIFLLLILVIGRATRRRT